MRKPETRNPTILAARRLMAELDELAAATLERDGVFVCGRCDGPTQNRSGVCTGCHVDEVAMFSGLALEAVS